MMPRKELCWNDIQKMRKTWSFVNEVLRNTPVVQGILREAIEDFTYEDFYIPKGWKVRILPFSGLFGRVYKNNAEYDVLIMLTLVMLVFVFQHMRCTCIPYTVYLKILRTYAYTLPLH